MKIKIIFLVQSIVLILLLSGCENEQLDLEREEIIRPVKTMTVKYPEQNSWREFPAVVESARQAELSFKIKGTLKSLKVKESQKVDKGQILAELDTTDYQIELNSAKAEFETAQANYKRGQQLIERKVISQADFDELRSKFVSAKSKLETAKQNIIYTQLRAPFSGEITKRFIDTYMEVAPQQPIYNLQDLSLIVLVVQVPESVMIQVKKDSSRRAFAYFDSIPDKTFPLVFKEAATEADPKSQTYEVKLSMEKPEGYNILPGMTATVRGEKIITKLENSNILVPSHSVLKDSDGQYVFIAEKTEDVFGIVKRRKVEIGTLSEQGLNITNGLQPGDILVIAGMSKMQDGMKVKLMDKDQ